jgi:hypothetical protein
MDPFSWCLLLGQLFDTSDASGSSLLSRPLLQGGVSCVIGTSVTNMSYRDNKISEEQDNFLSICGCIPFSLSS